LDSESTVNSSAAKLQNLTLHRSTLADHRREFSRLKSSIAESRNRANLLYSVRDDINAYRSASRIEEGRSEAEYMLDERTRLDNSHNIADSVLSQAYAINADFGEQRARLVQLNRRAMHAASLIPGVNTLITKINSRKRRDSILLALLISACFLMVFWFR
jgi:Golgi SNAP receptor complex protein 1